MPRVLSRLSVFVAMLTMLASDPAGAESLKVEQADIRDMKAVFATVETADVITARARIGGTLSGLAVDEGRTVREGAVIARIVDPKLQLQLNALEARIKSAQSQKDLAETAYDRAKALRESGTIAQVRLDEAESNLQVSARNLDALTSERKVIAERQAEGAVRAPASGRVLKVHAVNGAVVLPGEVIATLAAEGYVLRAQLPERHARTVAEGDLVYVGELTMGSSPDGNGKLRTGVVRQVYPEIKQGRVTADIEAEGIGDFYVGERVRVYVPAGLRRAIVVPERFIKLRFGISFVRLESGAEVVVQTGQTREGNVEILTGLNPGDVIVAGEAQ